MITNYKQSNITLNKKLATVRNKLNSAMDNSVLFNILFEMNRYFDKQFVDLLHKNKLFLKQDNRNNLRLYFYYGKNDFIKFSPLITFPRYTATEMDKLQVLDSFIYRCNKYDETKIISSIKERYKAIAIENKDNTNNWLDYYYKKRTINSEFSTFIFDYSQKDFIKDKYQINNILKVIANIYDKLENYRHLIFKLNGKLFNSNNEDVTWKILSQIGIYCENFIQYTTDFKPFNKEKQIQILTNFLDTRFPNNKENNKTISSNFYSSISTGFKFEDCLISDNQENIILVYKKIKLDSSPIPCPSCMSTIQNGNSFPEMFLRSYECKNPSCKERSKSGRGKRFDEYGVYRYFKLKENKQENAIDEKLFQKWRRDIFDNNNDIFEMLINFYTWDNENICISKNIKIDNTNSRNIVYYKANNTTKYNYNFEKLPICKLFKTINKLITKKAGSKIIKNNIEIINKDSSSYIATLKPNQIGTAITSPPYYNAREYSQWQNVILYLIDMMINASTIYQTLCKNGYYIYNIGDIVNADNIYVASNMSKKRLQLGFLSVLIFEYAGFNVVGNIIWDKGEVQSKRNSTMNHFAGYVKCINCYEHVLVFKKGVETKIISTVQKINPVIKINSKGVNIYKHSAPYPIDIVELIKPFLIRDKYILDPFLGSGTTLQWCKKNNVKGIGCEINKEYFRLSKKNIENYECV